MKSANQTEIQKSFTQQAENFENGKMNFSKKEYLDYTVSKIAPTGTDNVLEVAAGTCACGRAVAPGARSVTCLDMTPAMLEVGRTEAEKEGLHNMHFVLGDAAELPFLDNSFDIVLSRLAFHHFPNTDRPFAEMARVLKPGGKLVMIDMEAAEEALRTSFDGIEKLRDPSHVRCLSKEEMLALYRENGLTIFCDEIVKMPVILQNWMDHTATPPEIRAQIKTKMEQDIAGGTPTGFYPYYDGSEIRFNQRWVLLIGHKENRT